MLTAELVDDQTIENKHHGSAWWREGFSIVDATFVRIFA